MLDSQGDSKRDSKMPETLSAHDTHMLLMRATILTKAMQDAENMQEELRDLRDHLESLPTVRSETLYHKLVSNIEDRRVSLQCAKQSIRRHRDRLEQVLERIGKGE